MMPTTLEELRRWLISELPKWLHEHPELTYTLKGVLADVFVHRDEWQNLMQALERLAEGQRELQHTLQEVLREQERHSRILQEHSEILREHTQAIRALQEQQMEHSAILREQTQAIKALQEQQAQHSAVLREHTQAIKALQEQQAQHSAILQEHTQAIRALQEQQMEHSAILREQTQAIKALQEQQIQHSAVLREHTQAIRALQEQQAQHSAILQEHSELLKRLDSKIGALGRRWGLLSEAAFREGMYELLTPYGFRVERFLMRDEEGHVFGRPEQIEVDLLIRDDAAIAAEIRSSVSKADVWVFLRKVKFLEKVLNQKFDRQVIISPFVDDDALDYAQEVGVEVFTAPDELRKS